MNNIAWLNWENSQPQGSNRNYLTSEYGVLCVGRYHVESIFLDIGHLMARYCIAFDTVKLFSSASGNESLVELVIIFFVVFINENNMYG